MINSNEMKNRLLISSVKILLPNVDKSFYLTACVNQYQPVKTNFFDFKKSNAALLNEVHDLDNTIDKIDVIKFQLFEKISMLSSPIFKGEIKYPKEIKDVTSGNMMCYLYNSNNENCAIVYYRYEISQNPDIIQTFDSHLRQLETEQKRKKSGKNKSGFANFLDLARGQNAENFSKFVHNMEYLKTVQREFEEITTWKIFWKTLSLLLIFTYMVVYFKFIFVFLFPLSLIFFHLLFRNKLDEFTHKNTKHDNLENMKFITKTIELTNDIINIYECFIDALQFSDSSLMEEIYLNLLKCIFLNCLLVYTPLLRFLNLQMPLLLVIWGLFIWRYPPFKAFFLFMMTFIRKKFLKFPKKISDNCHIEKIRHLISSVLEEILLTVIPFAGFASKIYKVAKEREMTISDKEKKGKSKNEIKEVFEMLNDTQTKKATMQDESGNAIIVSTTSSYSDAFQNSETGMLKFELYENERWWMLVGWAKKLILNEVPLWCEENGTRHIDRNMVFLPNNEEYQWASDWKIEAPEYSDPEGWQYASDFHSTFGEKTLGRYVRRRKWVRYAKKIIR